MRGAVIVGGYNAPIVNALHPTGRVAPLPPGERGSIFITPGYYDIDWFESLLNAIPGVSFKAYRESKKVTLIVTDTNLELRLNREVSKLLDLPRGNLLTNVIYKGNYNIDPFQVAFIHCAQINCSDNYYQGQPSNVLYSLVPTQRLIESIKTLINSRHNKLTFSIKNDKGEIINNKGAGVLIECEVF